MQGRKATQVYAQFSHPLLNAANFDPDSDQYASNRYAMRPFNPDQALARPTPALATLGDEALLAHVPNLAANITAKVESALHGIQVMLGGGTGLTLKHPARGRLGPASRNMRDLDFDLEISKQDEFNKNKGGAADANAYLKGKAASIQAAVQTALPPPTDLMPNSGSVTNNDTLIFKYYRKKDHRRAPKESDSLEISFHMDNPLTAVTASSSVENTADNGKNYRLLNDASHLAMALEALEGRLGRPDKLWKNLQDPLVLAAGLPKESEQQAAVGKVKHILQAPAADSAPSRTILAKYADLAGNGTIQGFIPVKTADGRALRPAWLFGYNNKIADSLSVMNSYWNPGKKYWLPKQDVDPSEQAHYHQDFKDSYTELINSVVDDLKTTAGKEGRIGPTDWPHFLPEIRLA